MGIKRKGEAGLISAMSIAACVRPARRRGESEKEQTVNPGMTI